MSKKHVAALVSIGVATVANDTLAIQIQLSLIIKFLLYIVTAQYPLRMRAGDVQ